MKNVSRPLLYFAFEYNHMLLNLMKLANVSQSLQLIITITTSSHFHNSDTLEKIK